MRNQTATALAAEMRQATAGAMHEVLVRLLEEVKPDVPIEPRARHGEHLRDSGKVEVQDLGHSIEGRLSFESFWAIFQHEDVTAKHPHGGKAKFLEDHVKTLAAGRFERELAQRIRARVKL